MGEDKKAIFNIGSPDLDLMNSKDLPPLEFVKNYYDIEFDDYAILMFHPVTTELQVLKQQVKVLIDCIIDSDMNYVVIYPNNDLGSDIILDEYSKFQGNKKFKVFPSLRFEYFLVLLKNAKFMIGNSSAGIREAPYYNIPTINIGSRQNNRAKSNTIRTIEFIEKDINLAITDAFQVGKVEKDVDFGNGGSDKKFFKLLEDNEIWNISNQKQFKDLV